MACAYDAYYMTIKKTAILINSTTGMKFEYIILNEMLGQNIMIVFTQNI